MESSLPPIQLGIDIATFVSVLGAALAFIYTQLTQAKRIRRVETRNRRISHMAQICEDLAEVLTKGDEIISRGNQGEARGTTTIDADDFTNFCISVDRYIRIKTVCSFSVWATPKEQNILNGMASAVREWNQEFVDAHVDRTKPVPRLEELLKQLTALVSSLSQEIRSEIEAADA
jgi:hypothetical protein